MAMSSSMRRRSGLMDEWVGCGDIGSSSRAEGRPFMLGARPGLPQPLNAAYECTRPRQAPLPRSGFVHGPKAVGLLSRRSPEEAAYQRPCVGKGPTTPRRRVAHRSVPGADFPGRLAEPKSCARHFVRTPAAGGRLRRGVISVPVGHRQSTASTEAGDPEAIMTDMQYVAPTTLEEAIGAFAAAGNAARILAGGTDLLVQMRSGIVKPGLIVDIKKIAEMTEIAETADGGFRIGAAVSGANLAEHPRFREVWPGVLEAANLIGSKQVQGRASAGGNLCNA